MTRLRIILPWEGRRLYYIVLISNQAKFTITACPGNQRPKELHDCMPYLEARLLFRAKPL
jgi:hypothetical protein